MSPATVLVLAIAGLAVLVAIAHLLYRTFPVGAIYKSKTHLEHAFDSFDDPLAVIDGSYVLRRVNRAYTLLVGRDYSSCLGKRCYAVLRGSSEPCEDCRMPQTLRSRNRQVVTHSPHPSGGADAWISLTFFPFSGRDQQSPPAVVEHVRDITELEELRDRLQNKNLLLERTSEELREAQATLMTEIDMAREVQESVLPKVLPEVEGLLLDVLYQPVESVGGDMYDIIPFRNGRTGIFIGDASGHGLPAAFVSTMAKMSLYHHTRQELESSDLLQRINVDIASNIRTSHYLTCVWCTFDSAEGTLRYVRAGHPRPIVVKPGGDTLELDAPGSLVGILDRVSFTERTYQCTKGERIFLFTDGVFAPPEGASMKSITQSIDPFRDLLASCASMPFKDVIPWLRAELAKETREDDYTVLVMEVC